MYPCRTEREYVIFFMYYEGEFVVVRVIPLR